MLSLKNKKYLIAGRIGRKQKRKKKTIAKAFFGAKQITRRTVFWSEPALQLCKLGWIQILHNNLLSWSLAFWTELPSMRVCANGDTTLTTPQARRSSRYSSTWMNQEKFPINNGLPAPGRVLGPARARHAEDSYHSSWETSHFGINPAGG